MENPRRTPALNSISFALFALFAVFTASCGPAAVTPASPTSTSAAIQTPPPPSPSIEPTSAHAAGAFTTGAYRNLFKERGKTDAAIQAKLDAAWQQLFYGDEANQRVYFPAGADMAYIKDIGQGYVHSEGMSYGMMIAVQMNKRAEFDRLWKWARTH